MRQIKNVYLHCQNVRGHQTWNGSDLPLDLSSQKFKWPCDHIILQDHMTNKINYISTNTLLKATKFGRMMDSIEQFLPIKLFIPLITWSYKITWQSKAILCLWSYCWLILKSCYQYSHMTFNYVILWNFHKYYESNLFSHRKWNYNCFNAKSQFVC